MPDKHLTGNATQGQRYDLVVGILSARSNFYLRESLRKTWVGHAQKHSLLRERYICIFVVGFLLQEMSSVNFMHFRPDPRRCKNVTKGPLARIEPAIPVQRSNQLGYRVQLSSLNCKAAIHPNALNLLVYHIFLYLTV